MDAPHTTPLLGGRFRLVRCIGEGGMGSVWEAFDEQLRRRVAVKLLRRHLAEQAELVARFWREAEAAAALEHPNIVRVTDRGVEPEVGVYQVMELLQGSTLESVLAQEKVLSPGRAAFIGCQVLDALQAAHVAGIVHRDLKPGNIFLTTVSGIGDVVKLLDFGIAKLTQPEGTASKLTSAGTVLGTPAYMSPEQARGLTVDARSDVYSLGVVLFECLSGVRPFHRDNYNAVLFAILEDPVPQLEALRPELPAGLVQVLHRAIARDLQQRFSSAEEFRLALEPYREITTFSGLRTPPPGAASTSATAWRSDATSPSVAPTLPAASTPNASPAPTPSPWPIASTAPSSARNPGATRLLLGLAGLALALVLGSTAGWLLHQRSETPPRDPSAAAPASPSAAPQPPPPALATPPAAPAPAAAAAEGAALAPASLAVCGGIFSSQELQREVSALVLARSNALSVCFEGGGFTRGHLVAEYDSAGHLHSVHVLDGLSAVLPAVDECTLQAFAGATIAQGGSEAGSFTAELCASTGM